MSAPATAPAAATVQASVPASVTLTAPAGAEVWFDDWKAPAGASDLSTPPLKGGSRYAYDVRAKWKENGRTVTQTKRLTVSAGDHVRLKFPLPKAAPAAATH